MTVKRMDNIGIVVESLDAAIAFFTELGLKLEGRAMIEGEWAGRVTGLGNQCVEIAMLVTPDGHSRLELSRFLTRPSSPTTGTPRSTPSATYASCSRWTTSTRRSPGSARAVRNLSAKWFSTKRCIDSATSAAPKESSSGSPRSSGPAPPQLTVNNGEDDAVFKCSTCRKNGFTASNAAYLWLMDASLSNVRSMNPIWSVAARMARGAYP